MTRERPVFERFGRPFSRKLRDSCAYVRICFGDLILDRAGLDLEEPPLEGLGFEGELLSSFEMVKQARQFFALLWRILEIHLMPV